MIKPKAHRKNEASNFSLIENHTKSNSFDPSPLPNHLLDDLWLLAANQGLQDVCERIEEEKFQRLEKERERCYERHCN